MNPAMVIVVALLASVPPLTGEQRVRLDTAYDGRDHREEAFAALLEHVRTWTPGRVQLPVRLDPDLRAMTAAPGDFRGDLCRIAGRLERITPLSSPFDGVEEWCVGERDGPLALVYLPRADAEADAPFVAGRRVVLLARFYKRIDAIALDGRSHSYPAFVGAFPRVASSGAATGWDPTGAMWLAALLVATLGAMLMFVLLLARRARHRRLIARPRLPMESLAEVDEGGPLPDDPAEALAELRRRAEGGDSCTPSR